MIFMRDNFMTSRKLKRYTDWAFENGLCCAVGNSIPEEWT